MQCRKWLGASWGVIDGNEVKLRAVAPEIWSKLHVTDYDFGHGCRASSTAILARRKALKTLLGGLPLALIGSRLDPIHLLEDVISAHN
jgi:hypothetical protein